MEENLEITRKKKKNAIKTSRNAITEKSTDLWKTTGMF